MLIQINMAVQQRSPHRHNTEVIPVKQQEYAMSKKYGNTTVHVVAPPPISEEEKEKILNEFHWAAWAIIDELIEKGEGV